MDEKPDKKKESIDEILSDLNGLLNKMPSILDGIKMPELQPAEPPRPAPLPEPVEPVSAEPPQDAGDKTVVLQPFAGLPEGAPEPEQPAAAPAAEPPQDAGDKTVVLQPFAGLPEGAPEPERPAEPPPAGEKLQPQSLGDFMFGDAAGPAEPSAGQPAAQEERPAEPPAAAAFPTLTDLTSPEPAQPAAALPAYDSTKDFGIPDIDALLKLSDAGPAPEAAAESAPEAAMPEAGVIPEAVQSIQESPGAISMSEAAGAVPGSVSEEASVNEEPREEKPEVTPGQEPAPLQEAATPAEAEAQPAAQQEPSPFDSFALDQPAAPAQGAEETLRLEPAAEAPQAGAEPEAQASTLSIGDPFAAQGAEALSAEPSAELPQAAAPEAAQPSTLGAGDPFAAQGGEALSLEPAGSPQGGEPVAQGINFESAAEASGAAGLELGAPGMAAAQPGPTGADETMPGAAPELSVGTPMAAAEQTVPGGSGLELGGGSGDATLVVPPQAGGSGEEEKTVIFQASAPGTTSRAQAGDLEGLAAKTPPEGIPAERLRSLMFFYAVEDKALAATVLSELDSICLKSATKPMFIKRAGVKECDPDANPNFIQQAAAEAGAQGVICLGAVPQEKVYELENVFGTSGGFFRYYDSSTFSHSAALDLVTELILR